MMRCHVYFAPRYMYIEQQVAALLLEKHRWSEPA
jgi:hypothetical protein